MPKIEHILGKSPELAQSQSDIFALLERHPNYVFRTQPDDLFEIQRWLLDPSTAEPPPGLGVDTKLGYTVGTIRWALSTLHARDKIGSIKLHRSTYYGSHEAIKRVQARMPASGA